MKQGWERKKLGECFKLKSGEALTSNKMKVGVIPVYGGNGIAGYHDSFNLSGSNVIIGRVGALCGRARHVTECIWLTDNAFQIINFSNEFNYTFLHYLLNYKNLRQYARQAAQPVISNSSLKDVILEFPKSILEQQRIVAILDETFASITKLKANAEKNLKNVKELFESYLQSLFATKGEGWREIRLEECFKLKSGDGLTCKMMSEDGIYPVFGGNGIAGLHDNYNLSGSNVIIGRVGALCGNVRHLTEKIWLTDNAFRVVDFKYEFDHSFLMYLLNFMNLRSFARQAAQPVISNSSLKDVLLMFPKETSEQQTIVQKLDALSAEIKKLEAIYQKKIDDLEELKKSVLQKAFNGELKTTKSVPI